MMNKRYLFYIILILLIVLTSLLLASPNLLGKVGLIIYKYYYLRSFPRTLLTVTMVCSTALIISLVLVVLVERKLLTKRISIAILVSFMVVSIAILVKVAIDFLTWTYAHTGLRFRLGAYTLPLVLILIFANGIWRIIKLRSLEETMEVNEDILAEEIQNDEHNPDVIENDDNRS